MDASIALVVIGPLLAAVVAPFIHRIARSVSSWILALVPAFIVLFLLQFVASGEVTKASIGWVPAYGLELSFYLDGLSLSFALSISGIGIFVLLYAGAYLKNHPHLGRFYAFLLGFMGAMLGLVLADNMLALFMFWEATSVASFLLIGFDHGRQAARRGAVQALVITNVGGLALLIGLILLHNLSGSWELSQVGEIRTSPIYPAIFLCFLAAGMTKSAQFPFHFWLPNAMEAPTPVSAYLHSATMVQGGVYLFARMSPSLGGTPAWTASLVGIGGLTLLWGSVAALRQTDLKQMLAQTTIASLGLSVLLIGLGTEAAISAMVLYFVAHALYKAGLFMVVGAIDHGSGTRDITGLGGLADKMPVTFIGAALASLSMIGVPLTLGFLAKEEMYLGLTGSWQGVVVLVVLIAGNAMLAGVAMLILIKPFLGPDLPTPKPGHEAPIAMLLGPILLGAAGILAALNVDWLGQVVLVPAASAVFDQGVASHLAILPDLTSLAFWLSVLTWALAFLIYRQASPIRALLRRSEQGLRWGGDALFDVLMFGLVRFAGAVTRALHHGRLELYLVCSSWCWRWRCSCRSSAWAD